MCFHGDSSSPVGTAQWRLPKDKPLVELDAAAAQKSGKLLFEVALAVMFLLVLNVTLDDFELGRADAECSIPFLPGKSAPHPLRGTSLELLDGVSQGAYRRHDKQEMNVIGRTAGGDKGQSFAACDATQIGIEFGSTSGGNEWTSFFGAEYAMNVDARVCVCHFPPSLRDFNATTETGAPR